MARIIAPAAINESFMDKEPFILACPLQFLLIAKQHMLALQAQNPEYFFATKRKSLQNRRIFFVSLQMLCRYFVVLGQCELFQAF
jgi:hypothetical protein